MISRAFRTWCLCDRSGRRTLGVMIDNDPSSSVLGLLVVGMKQALQRASWPAPSAMLGLYACQHRNASPQGVGLEPGIAENEAGGRGARLCRIIER
jgi:hypothetical protein